MEDVSISLKGYPGIFPGFCIPLAVWESWVLASM
jgi:hypothetical protein